MGEILDIGKFQHLFIGGISQAFLAETERCAPKSGHALQQAVSRRIGHINAVALTGNGRTRLLMQPRIRLRMKLKLDVPCKRRVDGVHDRILLLFTFPRFGGI